MIVLTLRTDKPEAEIGIYDGQRQLAYEVWQAHRELSSTIHRKIQKMLDLLSISIGDVQGIVVYKGPGSFTGLRIGMSVANALAYSNQVPITAAAGKDWVAEGIKVLENGHGGKAALPEYGQEPKTTRPIK